MPEAGRGWASIGIASTALGGLLAAMFPTIGLLIIPTVAGCLLLRFWNQSIFWILLVVLVTVVYAVTSPGQTLYLIAGAILPATVLTETRRRGYGLALALVMASLVPTLAVLAFSDYFRAMFDLFVLTLENTAVNPEILALYPAQQAGKVTDYLMWWARHAAYYLPAMALTMVVSYYFFGALLGEIMVIRSGKFIKRVPPFTHWKASEWMIVAMGVAAIMILSGWRLLEIIGWNVLIFEVLLFSVFGVSLLEYYMRKAHLQVGVRVLVYLALFILQVIAGVLLPLAALFDAKYDFRKIRAKRFG